MTDKIITAGTASVAAPASARRGRDQWLLMGFGLLSFWGVMDDIAGVLIGIANPG